MLPEKGRSMRSVSLAIGKSENLLKDFVSGKTSLPREDTLDLIAAELGVTIETLRSNDDSDYSDTVSVDLAGDVEAQVQSPESFQKDGWAGIDLLVTLRKDGGDVELATVARVGDMMVIYPTDADLSKGAPVPYEPLASWYNGEVVEQGKKRSVHITGVVRYLTVPCNSEV